MYLLGIPDWLFWWGFVALILALLILACYLWASVLSSSFIEHFSLILFRADDSLTGNLKCFFYALSCFLPCLWCPLCCWIFYFDMVHEKCKLCGKEILDIIEHRKRCRWTDRNKFSMKALKCKTVLISQSNFGKQKTLTINKNSKEAQTTLKNNQGAGSIW